MLKYRVKNFRDLESAVKSNLVKGDAIVEITDEGIRAAVFFEDGGSNSLGGARSVIDFPIGLPDGIQKVTVSIPIGPDPSYGRWERALILYPFNQPLLLSRINERWGEWSPNYFKEERFVLSPDGRIESIPIVEEFDD